MQSLHRASAPNDSRIEGEMGGRERERVGRHKDGVEGKGGEGHKDQQEM